MNIAKKYLSLVLCGSVIVMMSSCAAKVGSESWCANMKEKPKGDWSTNQTVDYTKHCIFK